MRRARIKAVANVPIRRKVAPGCATEIASSQIVAAKPLEKPDNKEDPVLETQKNTTGVTTSKTHIKIPEESIDQKEYSALEIQKNTTVATTSKTDIKEPEESIYQKQDFISALQQSPIATCFSQIDVKASKKSLEKEEEESVLLKNQVKKEKEVENVPLEKIYNLNIKQENEKTDLTIVNKKLSNTNEEKNIQLETSLKGKESNTCSIFAINGEDLMKPFPVSHDPKEFEQKRCTSVGLKLKNTQKLTIPVLEGSPTKTGPTKSYFTRPIPRLDGGGRIRRNSIQGSGASASESEDDSRRSTCMIPNRVRNDSLCSIQSLKDSGNISKLNAGQKRKMIVSESARKLAEARREFLLKHENTPPDKTKLTMYDLIYYNPTTNPMKPKPSHPKQERKDSISISKTEPEKEKEDIINKPSEMIVPQVKIGPNGELIIDEQSLVIDQRKGQEDIDRSDIMVEDDSNGGFYKKRKKSKDWSKWETLKFYKALNTYGTDFLLMQSIFPKRSRQELKLKYKKEERVNQTLIEKALRYQEFDTEALNKDIAKVEEDERLESESKKSGKKRGPNSLAKQKKKRQRCKLLVQEVTCEDDEENSDSNKQNNDDDPMSESENINQDSKIIKRRWITRKRKVIQSDASVSNESAMENSDSETEVYKTKPTRSGRVPKRTKKSLPPVQIFDFEMGDVNKSKSKKKENENNSEIVVNNMPDEQHSIDDEEIQDEDNNNDKIGSKLNKLTGKSRKQISDMNMEKEKNLVSENQNNKAHIVHKEECSIESTRNRRSRHSTDHDSEKLEDQYELLETLGVSFDIKSDGLDKIIDYIPIQPEGLDNIVDEIPNHAIDLDSISDNTTRQMDHSSKVSNNLHEADNWNNIAFNISRQSATLTNVAGNISHQQDNLNIIKNNNSNKFEYSNNFKDKKSVDSNNVKDNIPTNSKLIKNIKLEDPKIDENDTPTEPEMLDNIVDDIPNMEKLKPGSLVVLKKNCENEPGKTTLQVYIVSSNFDANNPNYKDNLLPIDLPPEILRTVTNCIEEIEPEDNPQ